MPSGPVGAVDVERRHPPAFLGGCTAARVIARVIRVYVELPLDVSLEAPAPTCARDELGRRAEMFVAVVITAPTALMERVTDASLP